MTRPLILHENLLSLSIAPDRILSVNEKVYTTLNNYLRREDMTKTAQPSLIVGEAGSGKTFLIKRLYNAIRYNMDNALLPIVIEGKSLYSTEDIWAQCVSSLNISCSKNLFGDIIEWQRLNSKRIVLLIDNIQYYFNRTKNTDQYRFRGNLNEAGAPILIASSEKVLPAFTEYNAAFFDGFKVIFLKPMSASDIEEILVDEYNFARIETIMSYLPKTIRSMIIATQVIDKSEDEREDIETLSDSCYSHYQEKYDSYTTQVQRILSTLAQSDKGLSLTDIREKTHEDNSKLSPYLKIMMVQNLISKEVKTLRGGKYSIMDPLLRYWLRRNVTMQVSHK